MKVVKAAAVQVSPVLYSRDGTVRKSCAEDPLCHVPVPEEVFSHE